MQKQEIISSNKHHHANHVTKRIFKKRTPSIYRVITFTQAGGNQRRKIWISDSGSLLLDWCNNEILFAHFFIKIEHPSNKATQIYNHFSGNTLMDLLIRLITFFEVPFRQFHYYISKWPVYEGLVLDTAEIIRIFIHIRGDQQDETLIHKTIINC